MRRREFITFLGAAAAWPRSGRAQQPNVLRRIGVLIIGSENDPIAQKQLAALRDGLRRLDWVEGRNLQIDFRASGDPGRIRAYAEELVRLAPSVILTRGTAITRAVQEHTQTIPIVFLGAGDPVANGLVGSLARPGGNTTGVTDLFFTIGGKWLQLLKEVAPGITRFALIFNPEISSTAYFASIEAAADQFAVKAIRTPVRNAIEVARSIDAFATEPNGGLILIPPAPARDDRDVISRLAVRYRLPAIYQNKSYATEGGMMSYGPDSDDLFRRGGPSYVDRILRGSKPSEMPIQFSTKFELVFNLKAAKAIGLEIPAALLARADVVIG
jgi:putative tryptophan/tyrosine transport system substrate-binding protein